MNGPFGATPPPQREGILVDGNGYRGARDGDGDAVDGLPIVGAVFWELELCLGPDDFGGDAGVGGRV
jgi:hypothetical protein